MPGAGPTALRLAVATVLVGSLAAGAATMSAAAVPVPAAAPSASMAPASTATRGDLRVTLTGLPAGSPGKVVVTGPGGYTKTVTKSTTLSNLVPGTYRLRASSVTTALGRLVPATTSRTIVVVKAKAVSASFAYRWGVAVSTRLTVGGVTKQWVFTEKSARLTVTVTNRSKAKYLDGLTLVVPAGVTALTVPTVSVPSSRATWTKRVTACRAGAACAYTITLSPTAPTTTAKHLRYGEKVAVTLAFRSPVTSGTRTITLSPIGGGSFLIDGAAPGVRVVKGAAVVGEPGTPIPTAQTTVPVAGGDTVITADLPNGAYGPVNVYYEPAPCQGGATGSCVTATVDGTFSDGTTHLYGFGIGSTPEEQLPPASLTITCSEASCPRVPTVQTVSAGNDHTCALRTDQSVWCWGNNATGQLGNPLKAGTGTPVTTPVKVLGLPAVSQVSAGASHTCAIAATGGAVWCWGQGDTGQLGSTPSTGWTSVPRVVPTVTDAVSVSGGVEHTCAALSGGAVWCWGMNEHGQLGTSTGFGTRVSVAPTQVSGITTASVVSTGSFHTCAIANATVGGGQLLCWGSNIHGQLGNGLSGSGTDSATPTTLPIESVTSVDGGSDFTCAVYSGGLYCWGGNATGQLGTGTPPGLNCGTTSCALSPVPVVQGPNQQAVSDATQVSAGGTSSSDAHACALTTGSGVICWGAITYGQIGSTTNAVGAVTVYLPPTPTQVSAGGAHTCVARGTGAPECWGSNQSGQLGVTSNVGTTIANPYPAIVTGYYDDERLRDYGAYPLQVSLKVSGTFQPYGTAPMCSNPSMIDSLFGRGVIATNEARAASFCYDVGVSDRNPDSGELTRVILFAEDPRFTPISR